MKRSLIIDDESGGVLVLVVFMLVVFLGMAAFALDIGHLMLVRNELRNAADAGALAGARQLYSGVTTTGIIINSGANAVASDAAAANGSDASPSEVPLVQRGHWCFGCTGADGTPGVFTANDSLSPYNFMNMSFDQLDADTNYVNAVKVVTARGPVTPAASFFAGIFDKSGFQLNEESVAWLGCEGSKIKVDQPIAICVESVLDKNGNYTCSRGRMINSSGSGYSSGTGAWSNLEQGDDACNGAANANEVKSLAGCDNGAISNIILNSGPMTTVNGQIESAFKNLYTCWKSTTDSNGDGKPDRPWTMTLPLIKCGNKPPGPCNDVIGAIKVEVIWMTDQQDPHFYEVPTSYSDPEPGGASFSCSASTEEDRKLCWASFLSTYKIVDENGIAFDDATAANAYDQKNIVFKPSCELTAGPGNSGGFCANVLAKIPLLVK